MTHKPWCPPPPPLITSDPSNQLWSSHLLSLDAVSEFFFLCRRPPQVWAPVISSQHLLSPLISCRCYKVPLSLGRLPWPSGNLPTSECLQNWFSVSLLFKFSHVFPWDITEILIQSCYVCTSWRSDCIGRASRAENNVIPFSLHPCPYVYTASVSFQLITSVVCMHEMCMCVCVRFNERKNSNLEESCTFWLKLQNLLSTGRPKSVIFRAKNIFPEGQHVCMASRALQHSDEVGALCLCPS